MRIEVKRLTVDLMDQYLQFFDDIAFCDNPDWSQCYCCYNYLEDDNNVDTRAYCQELIKEGKLNGFLAFIDHKPVGWCNCDVITNYPRIMKSFSTRDLTNDTVAVVCFVVDPYKRGKGVATALLKFAMEYYKKAGFKQIEASSLKDATTDAENYIGPKNLYDKLGFDVIRESDTHYVWRKIF